MRESQNLQRQRLLQAAAKARAKIHGLYEDGARGIQTGSRAKHTAPHTKKSVAGVKASWGVACARRGGAQVAAAAPKLGPLEELKQ